MLSARRAMQKVSDKVSTSISAKHSSMGVEVSESARDEEMGTWHYLIVDTAGIRPREGPSYTKDGKSKDRLKEGVVLTVDTRVKAGWTKWLRLSNGDGWVFDVSPKDKKVRAVEVEVVRNECQYQIQADRALLLPRPSLQLAAKPMRGALSLEVSEVFDVTERVRPLNCKGSFLRLGDGRGWVLDFANGCQVAQRLRALASPTARSSNKDKNADADCSTKASAPVEQLWKESELGPSEKGEWNYVVLDPSGISLRSGPTLSKMAKLSGSGVRIDEGELVKVVERRAGKGTTFLRLNGPSGWAFDVQPGKHKHQRLAQVDVDVGIWFYRVCAPKGIALRSRLSFSDASKVGNGPSEGALLTVTKRVAVGETTFLKPRDEIGWVFDCKNGTRLVEGPVDMREPAGDLRPVLSSEFFLHQAPTTSKWAVTKMLLLQDSRVCVRQLCEIEKVRWAKVEPLSSSSKMEGWLPTAALEMEQDRVWDAADPSNTCNLRPGGLDAKAVLEALQANTDAKTVLLGRCQIKCP